MLETWVGSEPVLDRATQMAGQVIGDEVDVALRIGVVERLQQGEVATRVACRRRLRQDLPIAHAEGAVDPDLLEAALIIERYLDAVAIR